MLTFKIEGGCHRSSPQEPGKTWVRPEVLTVPCVGTGEQVTIEWRSLGIEPWGSFEWTSQSHPGVTPAKAGHTFKLTYAAPAQAVTWTYKVYAAMCTLRIANFEIRNVAPEPGSK